MKAEVQARPMQSRAANLTFMGPLAIAVLGPLLPLLIIFAGTLPASAPHVNRGFALAVAGITGLGVFGSCAGLAMSGARSFPRTLTWPLLALVGSQLLALVFAVKPSAGVFGLCTTLAGVIIMLAAIETLRDLRLRRTFLACYFASSFCATIFAIVLSVMRLPPAAFAYEHGRASGTFLQPNEFAGYLLFAIPLGVAQIAAPRWLRALGFAAAAAGAAGLVLSVSRAAIISLGLGLSILMRHLGSRAFLAYALSAAIALTALVTVFRDVAHDPSENASRVAVWRGSLRMAERFALTGVGPFNFRLAYPEFKSPDAAADELHAHDLPLHILIEDGVLGLAALTWFALAAVREAMRAGRAMPSADREASLVFAALGAGFAASALQSVVDVVTTFLLVVSWPMLGLLLSLGHADENM